VASRPHLVERELTGQIIAAFFHVYNTLGFGFLEANYARALVIVLERKGIRVQREAAVTVCFEGQEIGHYRLDLLIEGRIVVEVKASEVLHPSAKRQLRNYLAAMKLRVGLLLHFGPKPEFYRVVGPG
jgi:GxxExxY protein